MQFVTPPEENWELVQITTIALVSVRTLVVLDKISSLTSLYWNSLSISYTPQILKKTVINDFDAMSWTTEDSTIYRLFETAPALLSIVK